MVKFVFGFLGLLLLLGAGLIGVNILLQPARILQKTFDADNVIQNYEWYKDAFNSIKAKRRQIVQFKSMYAAQPEGSEKNKLRIDMAGIQQICRDLSAKYNSNASKVNRSIFMGTDTPSMVNVEECD